ncbi:hypothetical protein CTAYLR_007959 [Chrysophaeum taylorii]|uniref:Uncharacterized protein n=1 Tax=Chrysophaeum taylorii TaxID=2483200 RepID=A0AAD7UA00_9STRA|nr:hypothetical protein CTAYLR_007959 [Chrysophaeum taylorii]
MLRFALTTSAFVLASSSLQIEGGVGGLENFLPREEGECVLPVIEDIFFVSWPLPNDTTNFEINRTVLYYTRIPKTGSTTMRSLIKPGVRTFGPRGGAPMFADQLLEVLRSGLATTYALFTPHTAFGLHAAAATPCKYAAVLREPFSRMVSLFYENVRRKRFKALYSDPVRFLQACNGSFVLHNMQTAQLCGYGPECASEQTALALARRHLDDCYVAGVLEDLPATLDRFHDAYPDIFPSSEDAAREHVQQQQQQQQQDRATIRRVHRTSQLEKEPSHVQQQVEALQNDYYPRTARADYTLWNYVKRDLQAWKQQRPRTFY